MKDNNMDTKNNDHARQCFSLIFSFTLFRHSSFEFAIIIYELHVVTMLGRYL